MPDVTYGPWVQYGPLLQDYDFTEQQITKVNARGYFYNAAVVALGGARSSRYRLTQSFAAHAAGNEPWLDLDARYCALHHAANEDTSFDAFWNTGHCNTVTPVPGIPGSAHGGDADLWAAGTETSWSYAGIPMIGDSYDLTCWTGIAGWSYQGWPYTDPVGWEYLRTVAPPVLMQIPGWYDYISTHSSSDPQPQVYPVRVDVDNFRLKVRNPQSTTASVSATGYRVPSPPYVFTSGSYAGYGACPPTNEAVGWSAQMTVAGSAGSESGGLDFSDVHPGDLGQWAVVSDRVASSADPGATEYDRITGGVDYNAWWTVMARFPLEVPDVLDVLRWRQRDDGLGMTGASRHRSGTSLQRGSRWRGYR